MKVSERSANCLGRDTNPEEVDVETTLSQEPCEVCGTTHRRKNGECGTCLNARSRANAIANGKKKREHGIECPKCGAVDWNDSGQCRPCTQAYSRAYRAARRVPRYCEECGLVEMAGAQKHCAECAPAHQARQLAQLLATPCDKCGATDRFPSGKCRPCEAAYKLEWGKRQRNRTNPCRVCGNVDFTPSGRCRPCGKVKKARQALAAQTRPCLTCGELDRTPSGACRPCTKKTDRSRQRALGKANALCEACGERNRTPSGRCRTCQNASLLARTECGQCGGTDLAPSGRCRPCTRNQRMQRTECPDCGSEDLTRTGHCRPCRRAEGQNRTHCPKCSSQDLTPGGECRPCKRARALSYVDQPCNLCGVTDRTPTGSCRPCSSARQRAHYLANREAYYAKSARRRARIARVGGTYKPEDIGHLKKSQKGRCWWCGEKLGKKRADWHVDHVIPLAKGGPNDASNIRIACVSCNLSKHTKTPWEFAGRLF